jgi:uncharacterized protein involved in response to NO
MLFGFTLAVIVGFLFTAGRNWTGRPTPAGWPLAALALLWIAARVLVLTPYAAAARWRERRVSARRGGGASRFPSSGPEAAATTSSSVCSCCSPSRRASSTPRSSASSPRRRARRPGRASTSSSSSSRVMAGRVIPMFTNNGVRGARRRTRHPAVERVALGSVLLLLALDAIG